MLLYMMPAAFITHNPPHTLANPPFRENTADVDSKKGRKNQSREGVLKGHESSENRVKCLGVQKQANKQDRHETEETGDADVAAP